ncbi:MAG: TetR/AcrR family transcriptional regulator [Bacteroidetes bacterium]|nr:MAG: TetR/AcrR family transcriptional regulator [Bacteroidota bacterium]
MEEFKNEKRAYYIKESLKLFLKYGIRTVTVGQITSHLNISSKTLYQLFGDKTGLVKACFELYSQNSHKTFEEIEAEAENVADMLIRFYKRLTDSLSRINPNFFNDMAGYFPEIWSSDEAFAMNHTRIILRRGVEEKIFVGGIDIELCAQTLTLLLRFMFEREPFGSHNSQRLLANVLWPYVRGISTPEGLEEFRRYRRFAMVG